MVIMVHVEKGHQHSTHIQCPNRRDGVWDQLSTSKVTYLGASITEMNLIAQYSFQVQIGQVMDGMLAQSSFWDYVRQEVQ